MFDFLHPRLIGDEDESAAIPDGRDLGTIIITERRVISAIEILHE